MIKIEYFNDSNKIIIFNENKINDKLTHFDFIAEAILPEVKTDDAFSLFEISGPVARPTYGNLLYQSAAMLIPLIKDNAYVCSARDGDTRSGAYKQWEFLWINVGDKVKTKEILEHSDNIDYTNEDESPCLFHAFKLKSNEKFIDILKVKKTESESLIPKKIREEWGTFFETAYENDSNLFISQDFELSQNVNIDDILTIPNKKIKKHRNRNRVR